MTKPNLHIIGRFRGLVRSSALCGVAAILAVGAQLSLMGATGAQATTAPTNSITVRVDLTDSGVKLTPPHGYPIAEAGYVTLFRVYNHSSSSRRFMAASQGVLVKKGKNSGFYVYFPVISRSARLQWRSTAIGGGAKNYHGLFSVHPCKSLACQDQG